jgi:signal transduction histidine kinase
MSDFMAERLRHAIGLVVLVLAYYGSAKSGYVLDFAGPVAAILWLPVGIAIAFLYLGGWSYWPGVLAGDLLANDYHALPLGSALGQTAGNMLEVLVAVWLMHRLVPDGRPVGSVRSLGGMLVALAAGVTLSATIGTLSLALGGVVGTDEAPVVWRTWWLGDACGALVVVPLAVAWRKAPGRAWWRARRAELALLAIALVALGELALRSSSPTTYIVFPPLIWSALRFGPRGATAAVALTSALTAWNTAHLLGPFVYDSVTRSDLNTQLFILVAALSTLCLAVVVAERRQFAAMLHASRARLVAAGDSERRRIERDLHDGTQERLVALAARLGMAERQARTAPDRAPALLKEADAALSVAIAELREITASIHPTALTDLGLARAIRSVAARSPVPVTLLDLSPARFDRLVEAVAYAVVAEAVANAQVHAHASQVFVRAVASAPGLRVEVVDDGVGGASERDGSGLLGLRDRVEAIGGTLRIESAAGVGTRVAAALPVLRSTSGAAERRAGRARR